MTEEAKPPLASPSAPVAPIVSAFSEGDQTFTVSFDAGEAYLPAVTYNLYGGGMASLVSSVTSPGNPGNAAHDAETRAAWGWSTWARTVALSIPVDSTCIAITSVKFQYNFLRTRDSAVWGGILILGSYEQVTYETPPEALASRQAAEGGNGFNQWLDFNLNLATPVSVPPGGSIYVHASMGTQDRGSLSHVYIDNITYTCRPPTPTPTHTPSPTATSTPTSVPLAPCTGQVNAETNFGFRSQPMRNSTELARLPNATPLILMGQHPSSDGFIWYRADYNGTIGWLRGDGVIIGDGCADLLLVDASANPLIAPYDYELNEVPDLSWATLPCNNQDTNENHINCTRVVYYWFYQQFDESTGRYPRLSDVIAAVVTNELRDLVLTASVPPMGINQKSTFTVGRIAAETQAANYWSVIYETDKTVLTLDELTGLYLSQVESWYTLANYGSPDLDKIETLLILDAVSNKKAAFDVLSQQWLVNDTTVRQWGNFAFGEIPDSGYNSLFQNQQVAYCYTVREFQNRDGNLIRVTQGDFWRDYRFVFIIGASLGEGYHDGKYDQSTHLAPSWLTRIEPSGPYPNVVVDPQVNDNVVGRLFLDCSEIVQPVNSPIPVS